MMRLLPCLALVVLVALWPIASAAGANGPHVEAVAHAPPSPERGDRVTVTLDAAPEAEIESIRIVYCRVDPTYACNAVSEVMTAEGDRWTGVIPWTPAFFAGTSWVGYQFAITLGNGSESKAPTEAVPEAPEGVPADAEPYYYYTIQSTRDTPSPAWIGVGIAMALGALASGVRHARQG